MEKSHVLYKCLYFIFYNLNNQLIQEFSLIPVNFDVIDDKYWT
jgi:hypothetical protein